MPDALKPQKISGLITQRSVLPQDPDPPPVPADILVFVFEKILDAGETFEVPLTENAATLRAGNAGSLYFSVNGQTYGPAGDGPEVIKNVVLAPDALRETYTVADIDRDADLKRFVAVAEATVGN